MYCVHCGNKLGDGDKFCSACGKRVIAGGETVWSGDVSANETDRLPIQSQDEGQVNTAQFQRATGTSEATAQFPPAQGAGGSTAQFPPATGARETTAKFAPTSEAGNVSAQASTDVQNHPQESLKAQKRSLLPIVAVALAAAALVIAIVALFALPTCSRNEPASISVNQTQQVGSQTSGNSASAGDSAEQVKQKEQALSRFEGWWLVGKQPQKQRVVHVHDSTVKYYSTTGVYQDVTVNLTVNNVVRFDDGMPGPAKKHGPGFFFRMSEDDEPGFFLPDEEPDMLCYCLEDGSDYDEDDECSREEPPEWADDIDIDSAETDQRSSGAASADTMPADAASSGSAPADEPDSNDAVIQHAIDEAVDAGMQVLTGTIRITTIGDRVDEVAPNLANDFANAQDHVLALLLFDEPQDLAARAVGNEDQVETRSGQTSIRLSDDSDWSDYDGLSVIVGAYADDLYFPSDVAGVLYSAGGDVQIIAAGEGGSPAGTSNVSLPDSSTKGYVLADSSTRSYSRSELQGLSNRELYLARNEIYARHGRMFKNADLQEYFNSKSWYRGTINPDEFSDDMLTTVERNNANLILAVERSRNSEYL